jgi:hypothetical protein
MYVHMHTYILGSHRTSHVVLSSHTHTTHTTQADAMWEAKSTTTLQKIREDVTRHRYGDDAHLDTTLEKLGLVNPGKKFPQMKVLTCIRCVCTCVCVCIYIYIYTYIYIYIYICIWTYGHMYGRDSVLRFVCTCAYTCTCITCVCVCVCMDIHRFMIDTTLEICGFDYAARRHTHSAHTYMHTYIHIHNDNVARNHTRSIHTYKHT